MKKHPLIIWFMILLGALCVGGVLLYDYVAFQAVIEKQHLERLRVMKRDHEEGVHRVRQKEARQKLTTMMEKGFLGQQSVEGGTQALNVLFEKAGAEQVQVTLGQDRNHALDRLKGVIMTRRKVYCEALFPSWEVAMAALQEIHQALPMTIQIESLLLRRVNDWESSAESDGDGPCYLQIKGKWLSLTRG